MADRREPIGPTAETELLSSALRLSGRGEHNPEGLSLTPIQGPSSPRRGMAGRKSALVSCEWLAAALRSPSARADIRVLDASIYLPSENRSATAEFAQHRIPSAQYFDINVVSTPDPSHPHLPPTKAIFEEAMGALDIGSSQHVVVYDGHSSGIFSSPRVWWTFQYFGHERCSVLDGGFSKWRREGRDVEAGTPTFTPGMPRQTFVAAEPNASLLRTKQDVLDNLRTKRELILDARSQGRFDGLEPEPRANMCGGHIPGSLSVPLSDLLDPEAKVYLPPGELKAVLEGKGAVLDRDLVCSCGSGVTACGIALAHYEVTGRNLPIYAASWAEWGTKGLDLPIERSV